MASMINPSAMLGVASALPALSIVAVSARFYIRYTHKQGFGMDDWLILPALLTLIGLGILIIIGVKQQTIGYTIGATPFDDDDWVIQFTEQLEWAFSILDVLNLGLVKLSILWFYRRVFNTGITNGFNIYTIVLGTIIVAWTISLTFANVFECGINFAANWAAFSTVLACVNFEALNMFWFASDVLLDIILFILRLQLSMSRRIGIVFVFCVGGLAVIASILRLIIFGFLYNGHEDDWVGRDGLIVIALFFYWSMIESGIAIIVACLPVLQIWIRKISVEQVAKNVLGIFSVHSLSQGSRKSEHGKTSEQGAQNSTSDLNDEDIELQSTSTYYNYHEEIHENLRSDGKPHLAR